MRARTIRLVSLLLFLGVTIPLARVHAQSTAGCGWTGATIPGLGGAEIRPKGSWKIELGYSYKYADKLIREDHIEKELQEKIEVRNLWTKINLDLEYGVTNRFTLAAAMPVNDNTREEGYKKREYSAVGFGDLMLAGRYWFMEPAPTRWNFFGEIGVQVPTGEDDQKISGEYKKSYIQPGLGQWGIPLRAGFFKGLGDFTLSGGAGYVINLGENDANYHSSNVAHASIGSTWTPLRLGEQKKFQVGFSLAFSGLWITGHDESGGKTVGNTGGTWYYATPGIFISPDGGNFSIYFNAPITLDADVHQLQCYESVSYNFGVQYRW